MKRVQMMKTVTSKNNCCTGGLAGCLSNTKTCLSFGSQNVKTATKIPNAAGIKN